MADSDLKDRSDQSVSDDQLRDITGISKDEERAMDERATAEEQSEASKLKDADDDTIGGGYKAPRRKRFQFTTRQKAAGGGIAGLLIGGGFGIFVVASGPLQFIHIAQSLQGFHFFNTESAADGRMSKLARYVRYRNTPERMRLGKLGNLMADRFETKLRDNGFEMSYTDKRKWFDGLVIDPERVPVDSEIGRAMNKNVPNAEEEVINALTEKIKIPRENIDIDSGKVIISEEGLGFLAKRRLVKFALNGAGYEGAVSAVGSRIMGRRLDIDWHPIKKFDKQLLDTVDKRLAKFKENREKRKGGQSVEAETKSVAETEDADGNKSPNPEAEGASGAAEETAAATKEGSISALKNHVATKIAGGVAAAIGILCTIKAVADRIDDVKQINVVLPLARVGMEAITMGNQVMSGQNIDMEQLSFMSKVLYDKTNKSSWASAKSIQAERGQDQTGPDIPDEAQVSSERNFVSAFMKKLPGIDGVCKAAGSVVGQAISMGIDFLGGPLSFIGGEAFGRLVAPKIIDKIVNVIAGNPISIDFAGADYGNVINYGARLAANETSISRGGIELDPEQSIALKIEANKAMIEDNKQRGIASRYLDYRDSRSLISKLIDKSQTSPAGNIENIASIPKNIVKNIAKIPLLYSGSAYAASTYDYGFPEYGFSVEDLKDTNVSNPYQNAEEVDKILRGSGGEAFKQKAEACFGIRFDADNNVEDKGGDTKYIDLKDKNCKDSSTAWRRIRFYIFDSQIMSSAACLDGVDEGECSRLGFDNAGASSSQTAQGTSIPANTNIYMVGNSLSEGMQKNGDLENKLKGAGWTNITVRAFCGRYLASVYINREKINGDKCGESAPRADFDGLEQINQLADDAAIKQAGAIVVELGTNDWKTPLEFPANVDKMISAIKNKNPSATIYWVNLYSTDNRSQSLSAMNAVLQDKKNKGEVILIDWAKEASSKNYYSGGDGLHPVNHYPEMSQFIVGLVKPSALSSQIIGNIGDNSESVPCAAGTKDMGVVTSKYVGDAKITTGPPVIRLCQLTSITGTGNNTSGNSVIDGAVVNSRVAGAWQALGTAAKSQGVQLTADSSFRLNDSCNGSGDGTLCARPGRSPHQLGVAIDFGGTDITGSSDSSCSVRATDPGSPVWNWLKNNALQFGFKQYTYESWHWDPMNTASRC